MTDTRASSARRPGTTSPGGRKDRSSRAGAAARKGAASRPGTAAAGSWPIRERSLIGPVLGIPPLVAVAIAAGLSALGVFVDLLRLGTVGVIFEASYIVGCVVAVAWVRRRSIFLPAIQPPLLLAVVVPLVAVLIGAPSPQAGTTENLLMAGAPLINAFPAMAIGTVVTLLLAGFRLLRQRTGPDDAVGQLRRRISGGASDGAPAEKATSGADGTRERSSGRTTSGRERSRTARPSASGRRTGAPEAATRTRTSTDRAARGDSGQTSRTGTSRSSASGGASATGSTSPRAEGPDRPRRPRR